MENIDQRILNICDVKDRADNAINSLKGILTGIKFDGLAHEKEMAELYKWVDSHEDLTNRKPFGEFKYIISQAISEEITPMEAVEDLLWLCKKHENDNYYYNVVTANLFELKGICHGILSDGEISEKEIFDLHKWLQNNEHLSTYYPYDEIRSLISSIVADKKVDEEEKMVLKAYFNQFIKLYDDKTREQLKDETSEINISGLCTSNPDVTFHGKTFCITGIPKGVNRSHIEDTIEKLGGIPSDKVSTETNYLIVGDNGNPAWAFSCYGRKVEEAIGLRKKGHTIMLIHEYDFTRIVNEQLS